MKKLFAVIALLLLPSAALAETAASIPPKISTPWGNSAGPSYIRTIPNTSQIGIQNCAASFPDGFPPLTFVPATSGGCPPFGQDFNGIFKQLSQWALWQASGGPITWDSAFSTAIGGYPAGALVASATTPSSWWVSTADNNTTNPDTGGAGWAGVGYAPVGSGTIFFGSTAPAGWLLCQGQAISRATYANLFRVIGTTYGAGDGSTTFNLPDLRARMAVGVDPGSATGRITGAGGNYDASVLGNNGGQQNFSILRTHLPNISFTNSGITVADSGHVHPPDIRATKFLGVPGNTDATVQSGSGFGLAESTGTGSGVANVSITAQGSAASGGSGTPLPVLSPSIAVNYIIKY
jgi:microcystin-dependent protein